MSFTLPPELAAAIDELAAGLPFDGLRRSASGLSEGYRASEPSGATIRSPQAALAYALSRMPATYAAVSAVMAELQARHPDVQPRTMVDAGAGPGTATWAASAAFASLQSAELRDSNAAFLDLAGRLAALMPDLAVTLQRGDLAAASPHFAPSDLVVCAYALTELSDAACIAAAEALWTQTASVLVLVEPGRPRDYTRLMAIRRALVSRGAAIVAPCPHGDACPLVSPDWCHFAVRLQRTRTHMQMKGGSLGYEDEKFSYLVLSREPAAPSPPRVIKPPTESKAHVALELCTAYGVQRRDIPSRDKPAFKAARKLRWGDVSEI